MRTRLIVFAKAPMAGAAKTRLLPVLGEAATAKLASGMLMHTLAQALRCAQSLAQASVELCGTPEADHAAWPAMDAGIGRTEQGEGDLGQRMQCAFARALASHDAALLMGTDCPALTHDILSQAAGQLQHHDAAMIPVHDGGYVMLGLKRPLPNVFDAMPWSTPRVAELTLQRLSQANASIWIGEPLHDIDEPQDLAHLPNDWHNLLKD